MTRKAAWAGFSFWAALLLAAAYRGGYDRMLLLTALGLTATAFAALERYRRHVALCFVFFAAGIGVNSGYTHFVYDRLIALDGQTVTITGHVKDFSQVSSDFDRVVVSGRVNGISAEISFVLPYGDLRYFDEITVTDTVSVIEDGAKFDSGSYNYSKSVFLQGGYGTGSYELTGRSVNPLFRSIREYRDKMFGLIVRVCPEREGAFLGAMLCGDKSEMSPALKTELYRSGLGHIFAVSGIHLVIAATFFGWIVNKLIRHRRLANFLVLAEVWGFAVFAGMSVSVVRAAVMLTVTRSGYLFGRKGDGLNSLGICAILLTVAKPYTAISPSFVLSFLAVLAIEIVDLSRRDREAENKAEYSLRLSFGVLFATAPASAAFFGGVSLMSVVTNMLLVPICSLSLQACFALLLTGGVGVVAVPLLKAAALPVRFALLCADHISAIGQSYVFTSSRWVFALVAITSAAMLAGCVLIKDSKRLTLTALTTLALWCAAANLYRMTDRDIRITVLPNGRRTAYIISKNGSAVVLDAGCHGGMDGALQRQMDRLGICEVRCAFISEQGTLTAAGYEEDFFIQPELIFVSDEALAEGDDGLTTIHEGNIADLGDMTVRSVHDGYEVTVEGNTVTLGKGKIVIGGDRVDISKERSLLELEGTTLRRL